MTAYYNEIEPYPCAVLRERIADGSLPDGRVDERDIRNVKPDDLNGFTHCHWFAGIGGFALAQRLAEWPDDLELWTGGFPCQDISTAGKGAGIAKGARSSLWWEWYRLIASRRPRVVIAENVPALRTRGYDSVADALEGISYTVRTVVVGAEHVRAPQKRHRVWIVADRDGGHGLDASDEVRAGRNSVDHGGVAELADGTSHGCERTKENAPRARGWRAAESIVCGESDPYGVDHAIGAGLAGHGTDSAACGRDGACGPVAAASVRWPARPGEPQHDWEAPRLLELRVGSATDGLSAELVRAERDNYRRIAWANKRALKCAGNAIVPQVAAAIMRAYLKAAI